MAKGNYTAYQQLKPAEIKVGELYSSWVGDYVKRGDAERAAALKRAQEEGKSLEDLMKDVKVEHATTITPWQNERSRLASEGIELVGNARMMATNMNIPIEQRRAYADKARNYANQIAELDALIKDPKLIEQYANNVKTASEGKAFKGDPRLGLYMSVEAGLAKFRTNKDGNLEVGYIENAQDPEKKETWELLSEVKQKYMTPIEESTVESYNKYLVDLAQKVTTETTTSNGYVRTYNKAFDAKDAKTLLMTSFGLDPSKDAKDNFNVNNIPRQLNHRFYDKNTRSIQSAADLEEAINDSVLTMKAAADEKTSREVLKTADDITLDKLQIANSRKNLYKQDSPSGASSGSGGGGMYNAGNQQAFIKDRIPNMEKDAKTGKMVQNGYKDVIRQAPMRILSLPKLKGQPTTENVFGVTTYKNKKGEIQSAYYLGTPDKLGKIVTSRIDDNELNSYFVKLGYNPMVAKQYLLDETKEKVPYIGTQSPRVVSRPEAENLNIFFKTKESNGEDDGIL
jgi:hypothetical protein